ncbi:MAG TPA: DNA repair protein RecN [Candidatus Acidoferrum sp.]|nr:DNA repair protein RecN [Candidatus Acidoferrum sp.]
MLTHLTIQNFALVQQLDLELAKGMTAITGETGAGKSIMLDALGLTLGDRADLDVIRTGAERADISATFVIEDESPALEWLREHDFPLEDDECILRRVLSRDGRSRAYINGQSTSLNELKALGELLIDIHSQHEHQSLLKVATHQRLLDGFGGLLTLAEAVRTAAQRYRDEHAELEALKHRSAADAAQVELLGYQVKELQELALGDDELPQLEAEHKQLSHADTALASLQEVMDLCAENDEFNLEQALRRATGVLEALPFQTPQLQEALALLQNALIQVEEAGSTLGKASARIEANPERLQEVDERLGAIHRLARKHRIAPAELPRHARELTAKLASLSVSDEDIAQREQQLKQHLADYRRLASELGGKREKAAKQLEKAINAQLAKLGMAAAKLQVALASDAERAPSAHGNEQIELLVSTNAGQAAKPLIKIASGGELSRISLAIQVVIAQTTTIPTLVFDEVDVGIGGSTAKTVGELLQQLGERGQVLCVTHQAQVAAQAHQHLLVSKTTIKHNTTTSLTALAKKERIKEIARMLSGDELSENSLAHAEELMGTA